MIHESYYWRKELIIISKNIQKKIKVEKNWSDSKYAKFEKDIMFGFYIIRKLMEAKKLSNIIGSTKFQLKMFASNGKPITLLNNHRFDENYNFENTKPIKRDLKFLINQFVHSYIFKPIISVVDGKSLKLIENEKISDEDYIEIYESGDKELTGILFNSDTDKNKFLYEIDIYKIIEIFEKVGNCNITKVEMIFNPTKGDYDTFQYEGENEISEETKALTQIQH